MVRYYTGTEPETVYVIAHSFDKDIAEMNDADTGKTSTSAAYYQPCSL